MKENLYHGCPELKNIMAYSDEKKRFLFHTGKLNPFTAVDCCVDLKGKTWFAVSSYMFGFQTKLYYRKTATKGFTFEKGKVSLWFKDHIRTILQLPSMPLFLCKMELQWFYEIMNLSYYNNMITKTVFEKVLSKKITNTKELIQHWIKYSIKDKTIDADLVQAAINSSNFRPMSFKWDIRVLKDKNEYLRHLILGERTLGNLDNLIQFAYILDEKIDCLFDKEEIKAKETEMAKRVAERAQTFGLPYTQYPSFL